MGWTIGKYRIELKATVDWLSMSIDDEPFKPFAHARVLGDFPLRIGKRDAIIRRLRNLDVARSELWLDGVCVPESPDSLIQKLAPKDTLCEGVHPESFRTAAAPAKYLCPTCRKLLCAKHIAVDRVRCPACFEAAGRADALALRQLRTRGPLLGAGLGIGTALLGAALDIDKLVGIGAAATVLVLVKVTMGYFQERKEARRRDSD